MLGASFDSVADNAAFAKKFDFPYPLLSDPGRLMGMAYGAADAPDSGYAARVSFLIDAAGKLLQVYDQVDPASHPAQVLADANQV